MLNRTFIPFPILKTQRLTLRQLSMGDDQQVFTLRSDRRVNQYLDRKICNSIDDARQFILLVNENVANNESIYWAITLTKENVLLGTICLFGFAEQNERCEIGYELLTNYQRQGIMKEAIEAVIEHAFHSINVQEIQACFQRNNLPSLKLLQKCSFQPLPQPVNTEPDLFCCHLKKDERG